MKFIINAKSRCVKGFIGSPYDRANPLVYGCWQLIEGVTIDNALLRCLRLPCHCDEGEQDGDDGFLVHNLFVLLIFRATKLQKGIKIGPWLNLKKKCQGLMSQLRLRVSTCYRLLFAAKRNVTPYFADSIWMNVQERSYVLQIK